MWKKKLTLACLSSFLHFFFPVYFSCMSDLHPSFLSSSFSVSPFFFVCLSRFFVCLVSFLSVCLLNFLLPFCFSLSSFPVVYLPFFLPVCLTSFLFTYCLSVFLPSSLSVFMEFFVCVHLPSYCLSNILPVWLPPYFRLSNFSPSFFVCFTSFLCLSPFPFC